MAAKDRLIVTLGCPHCGNRNYYFARGKKKDYKLEVQKFCRCCRKHTAHKETKS
ncbi:MAG: 50S ribosomal protein L33 [Elusimicrobia bacterium]|nr:50S ribosomal protein L33 [Elusimicrobiota bacterium]